MPIVEIWTVTAVAGTLASVWNWWQAWHDLAAQMDSRSESRPRYVWRLLTAKGNGAWTLTRGHVRREAFRLYVQGVFAFVGALAFLGPRSGEVSLLALLFISTAVALLASTLLDGRERLRLRRMLGGN